MRKVICQCLFFLLIAWFVPQGLQAQKISDVIVEGTAEFAKGEEIRLVAFDDLLTYTPKTVAKCKINKSGTFSLKFRAKEITLVQLVIRTSKTEFLIAPSRTYKFSITTDPQTFQLLEPEYEGGYLQLKNEAIDTNDINYKINRFSRFYELITNYFQNELVYSQSKAIFDTIQKEVDQRFGLSYDPTNFYKSYVYYSVASTDLIAHQKEHKLLYSKYFDNEYILYNNPAYMNFFNGFYDQYLLNSYYIDQSILGKYINENPNYLSLFNAVGKDPLLVNERIRELVIIKNLGEFFDIEDFDKHNVLYMLNYIQQSTHFPEHKHIIDNIKSRLGRMQNGSPFPYVTLKEANGANLNIQRFQGKWVYLNFFTSTCEDCIREMMILKKLQEEYADQLEIVSISVDFDENRFVQFISHYGEIFPWQFAHFNNQYEWLSDLEIGSLPDNILIDPNGHFAQRYAPDADKDLAAFLKRLFHKEEEDNNPMFQQHE